MIKSLNFTASKSHPGAAPLLSCHIRIPFNFPTLTSIIFFLSLVGIKTCNFKTEKKTKKSYMKMTCFSTSKLFFSFSFRIMKPMYCRVAICANYFYKYTSIRACQLQLTICYYRNIVNSLSGFWIVCV
jgi:hypothetical protein